MRLTIYIDGYTHQIDSTDPETLGRWMVEIYGRAVPITPATLMQVRAEPSFIPDPDGQFGMRADWIQDTRYMEIGKAYTPRELLQQLNAWLSNYESRGNDRDNG